MTTGRTVCIIVGVLEDSAEGGVLVGSKGGNVAEFADSGHILPRQDRTEPGEPGKGLGAIEDRGGGRLG